jgi:hypothetical protein
MLAISLSSMVYVFQDSFTPAIDQIIETLHAASSR